MHFDIATPPFAGHLHPNLGIARELDRRGHDVRILSTRTAHSDAQSAGIELLELAQGYEREVDALAAPGARLRTNPVRLVKHARTILSLTSVFAAEAERAFAKRRPDVALVDFTLPSIGGACDSVGIPWATSIASPTLLESASGVPGGLGGWLPREGRVWRIRDAAGRASLKTFKRGVNAVVNRDSRRLGFDRMYRKDGSEAMYSETAVLALGLREFEPRDGFSRQVTFAGPVRYTPPGYSGDDGCQAADVLVTLGTHLPEEKQRVFELVAEVAAKLPDLSFVFAFGDSRALPRPRGNLRAVARVDYDRLERFGVIVHHGGMGITWAAMKSGAAQVVCPFDYDQPDVAARLDTFGLAERIRKLRVAPLAVAIERALNRSHEGNLSAARFAKLVRETDGAVRAADLLERLADGDHSQRMRPRIGA